MQRKSFYVKLPTNLLYEFFLFFYPRCIHQWSAGWGGVWPAATPGSSVAVCDWSLAGSGSHEEEETNHKHQ